MKIDIVFHFTKYFSSLIFKMRKLSVKNAAQRAGIYAGVEFEKRPPTAAAD